MKPVALVIMTIATTTMGVAGGAGGAWWWLSTQSGARPAATAAAGTPSPPAEAVHTRDYRYVPLEKVIVMLRDGNGVAAPHYMSVDLVFTTPHDDEKTIRDHLPLLKSVAVDALSSHTVEQARAKSVAEFTRQLDEAYAGTYAADPEGRPFRRVLISKLLIE